MSKNFEEQEKKAKGGIRLAREEVFKLVFGAELTESTSDKLKQDFSVYLQNDEEFINALSEKQLEFIKNSINGIVENYDNIKDVIKKNTQNWTYERIGVIERSLLIVGTYEFLIKNTPIEVIANEIVELAKEYGNEKSYEFINGILANIEKAKNKGTI
ncbi:antitermination protein NusB [Fusobacterium nucleatum YWH7199]|uniref:Transcription antitermination protein NusB n=1 Tax=Fusobacterium nucleatum TaxID=851 RepID=A0A133NN80_FUSNU|nr:MULTISPECIES: transcription antitermination factor NusB [Fusobacterium]KXA17753.1 transcription antitermination factor NusB [Fusobacterium nucleatum]MCL4576790.1 antitermination protein NusB [Fusobacterium nucleatum YWH7056]MCL4580588.1 antitermination protein NusB [Fusobacterium nucleatum YWH7199]MCL4582378.1 antitermination protein NusB [Fusobacterium nucleatum YWH7054]MCL4592729.1 antitermination protein NusB [Fusobacterium nucleatum YWH7053]